MLTLLLVTLITAMLAWLLGRIAQPLKLMAYPGEHRLHEHPTPMVGGLAIFAGLSIGMVLAAPAALTLLPSLLLLCVIGSLDDRFHLPSWVRFISQGLAAVLMIKLTGVQLHSLGFLVSDIELTVGKWSTPLTIFATIGVINALNMSDGLDGLVGGLVILILSALLLLDSPDTDLILLAISATAGFLFWNIRVLRKQAKLYLGDAGSTMLGLLIAFLLINASQNPTTHSLSESNSALLPEHVAQWSSVFSAKLLPVTALWILALPLIDAVAVLISRPLFGKSPFAADRTHYHHVLLDRGWGVNVSLFIALAAQVGFISFGVWSQSNAIPERIQFYIFLAVYFAYLFRVIWFTAKTTKVER